MKSVLEFHKEGLDQALRQALATSQPALRREAMARASGHMIHPRLLLESPLLTETHPWYQEALVISDAFEAVTNGMEEAGVLSALEDLHPDSPFVPWRHLILALHFFYEGLDEAVEAHLAAIPPQSPVAPLARAITAVVRQEPSPGIGALGSLINAVSQPDDRLLATVQDVSEGLETEDEPLFWEALGEWLEVVAPVAVDQAQAAVLWVWNQLEWRNFDEGVLLKLSADLWGPAEAYRLAALGSLGWDAEGAALLWLRFLLSLAREGAERSQVAGARDFLDKFYQAAAANGSPAEEWKETWFSLTRVWNAEANAHGWSDFGWGAAMKREMVPPTRSSTDGQLDLFAS